MQSTVTLLCEGFAFAIPESTAKDSPVLSQVIESLPEAPIRMIQITDFDLDAVNCFVEFLSSRKYEVNRTLFPSVIESAGTGKPLQDIPFTRDLLLRHITMNTLGQHYKVSGLCEFARDQMQKILRSHWTDLAFLGVLNVALAHDDYELHNILWSQARSHLHSLTATSEFDPATFLRSFHSCLRTHPPTNPTMHDSAEVEKLKEQVTLLQKRVSEASSERDEQLQSTLKKTEELKSQVSALQQQVSTICIERDVLKQHVSNLCRERDGLHNTTEETAQILEKANKDTEVARLESSNASKRFEQAAKKLAEAEKSLLITNSERNLFRVRWEDEKAKSAALIKEVEDKRSIKDTVLTTVRDELKKALEAEQSEVKRLNTELEHAQRSFQAIKPMPQAERDRLYESLGAEKNRVVILTKARDQAIKERDAAKRQLMKEVDAKLLADGKIEDLIECFYDYEACRQCGWNFGCWVEDDGDRILVRCNCCRTRHWHD